MVVILMTPCRVLLILLITTHGSSSKDPWRGSDASCTLPPFSGSGLMQWGSRAFRVWGFGFGFRVQGFGFRVSCLGLLQPAHG